MAVEKGDEAPDFELPDQDGEPVRLSDLRSTPVVLYFNPRADTPGCTTQACGRVADVIPKVSPKTHDEQVLKLLGSM